MERSHRSRFQDLPNEIKRMIAKELDLDTRIALNQTSRAFRSISETLPISPADANRRLASAIASDRLDTVRGILERYDGPIKLPLLFDLYAYIIEKGDGSSRRSVYERGYFVTREGTRINALSSPNLVDFLSFVISGHQVAIFDDILRTMAEIDGSHLSNSLFRHCEQHIYSVDDIDLYMILYKYYPGATDRLINDRYMFSAFGLDEWVRALIRHHLVEGNPVRLLTYVASQQQPDTFLLLLKYIKDPAIVYEAFTSQFMSPGNIQAIFSVFPDGQLVFSFFEKMMDETKAYRFNLHMEESEWFYEGVMVATDLLCNRGYALPLFNLLSLRIGTFDVLPILAFMVQKPGLLQNTPGLEEAVIALQEPDLVSIMRSVR